MPFDEDYLKRLLADRLYRLRIDNTEAIASVVWEFFDSLDLFDRSKLDTYITEAEIDKILKNEAHNG